ncbi:auxin-responsive protein SAUR72-like [Panicum miliaceum]|uniref:Auxin-responsive protein SAUR72-like n=1 Tax=Panicum miliaceum TaxID=4540 RepID=A0A3L6RNH2_PANMI|nr:auxin-responsive protein SAUR72-like [Panicum miliaceum]
MAKGGLSKLRCMIRRWHSSSRIARAPSPGEDGGDADERGGGASFHGADEVPKGMHPTLVHRSGGGAAGGPAGTVVGCEVVLFEHLLWMLENADPQLESLDELVEYYAC